MRSIPWREAQSGTTSFSHGCLSAPERIEVEVYSAPVKLGNVFRVTRSKGGDDLASEPPPSYPFGYLQERG